MEAHEKDWDSLKKNGIQSKRISKNIIIIVLITIVLLLLAVFFHFSIGLYGCFILGLIIIAINKRNKNAANYRYSKKRRKYFHYNYESDE